MSKLKVKADLRKMEIEGNPNFKGMADLTIGDFVVKGVAVYENETENGKKSINFTMPSRKDKEKGYVPAVEIYNSNKDMEKAITNQIRGTLRDCLYKEEPDKILENGDNKTPIYSAERESNINYYEDLIKPYIYKVEREGYPSLRAVGDILVGGVLRIKDVRLEEYQVDGEYHTNIKFQQGEMYIDKDGKEQYPEKVFPIKEGLKDKLCELVEEAYIEDAYQKEDKQKEETEEAEV